MNPEDILRAMQDMEGRLMTRLDRFVETASRREDQVHERINATNKELASTQRELSEHKGKMAYLAAGIGGAASAVVLFVSKLIPGGH